VIRPARWLPLSLALHAATLGGGAWVVHESSERALFVDLTLKDLDERVAAPRGGSGGGGAPAATQVRRAAAPRRPPAALPPAASAPAAPAPATPTPAIAASPAPPPAAAVPSPASPAPAPDVSTVLPAPSPVATPERVAESSHASDQAAGGDATSGAAGMSTAAGGDGGDPAAAPGSGAAPGASGARGARDGGARDGGARDGGGLALAIPGDGGGEMYGPYLAALRRRLHETLEYPATARRRGLTGTVHLEIALEATGRVTEVVLVRSSSHGVLDDAAVQAARSLSRVPFPPEVRPRALRVRLPVVFELR
jgi:protein TonB